MIINFVSNDLKRASLNHTFRHIWNAGLSTFVPAPESARSGGTGRTAATLVGALLPLALMGQVRAADLPQGPEVVAGQMQATQTATTLNIQQNSDKLITNWQQFNIGQGHAVNFQQPSASSVALNRVVGSDPSNIQGALNANGQVFLVNPNGVLFAPGAQVNVGGIVATTHNISDKNFLEGRYQFSGQSPHAVVNQGTINSARGGFVSMVAARVVNHGTINTPEGKVLLGAGNEVLLDFGSAVKLLVKEGALNAMIESGGVIRAEGGLVYMSAKSAGDLASTVINHTGIIEAQTLSTGKRGEVYLFGDLAKDAIQVNGRIDASAPGGGDGGFVETSAAKVSFGGQVNINTSAASGNTGTWLIDPTDFYISASGGDITGATLSSMLTQNDVTIETATGPYVPSTLFGTRPGNGDIFVNDQVTYIYHRLTLNAERDIYVNAPITLNYDSSLNNWGGLTLNAGRDININSTLSAVDATLAFNHVAEISLNAYRDLNVGNVVTMQDVDLTIITTTGDITTTRSGSSFMGRVDVSNYYAGQLNINGQPYTVINDYYDLYMFSVYDPNYINGYYAIGSQLDAGGLYDGQLGSDPTQTFWGTIEGFGHSIVNLNVGPNGYSHYTGMVSINGGAIQNLGLSGQVMGTNYVGALAGSNNGAIKNVYSDVAVTGLDYVGGLVGLNSGQIVSASVATTVTGSSYVGGLVGQSMGISSVISSGQFAGSVYGDLNVGGLVGSNASSISDSSASAFVLSGGYSSAANLGGLVGMNEGATIRASFSSGCVGVNTPECFTSAPISGLVSLTYENIGGLVGYNYRSDIIDSGSSSNVAVWYHTSDSQAVTAQILRVGGLVGYNATYAVGDGYGQSSIEGSSASGSIRSYINVSSTGSSVDARGLYVGGLVGYAERNLTVLDSYSSSSVYVDTIANAYRSVYAGTNYVGGLVGYAGDGASISQAYSTGNITAKATAYTLGGSISSGSRANLGYVGGLVGFLGGSSHITSSFSSSLLDADSIYGVWAQGSGWNGGANAYAIGGLVGFNDENVTISSTYATGYVDVSAQDSSYVAYATNQSNIYGVGGLIGLNQSYLTLSDSYATGNVTARADSNLYAIQDGYNNWNGSSSNSTITYVGGLVGYNGRFASLSRVYSAGNLSITNYGVSGIYSLSGIINAGYYYASVSDVGGLVGGTGNYMMNNFDDGRSNSYVYVSSGNALISEAYATGSLSISNQNYTSLPGSSNTRNVGGLVGQHGTYMGVSTDTQIEKSYATGDITINHANVGVGLSNNNYTSNISLIGGLVGANTNDMATGAISRIIKSYAIGDITVTNQMGGGNLFSSSIGKFGGLVGYNGSYSGNMGYSLIQDSYALGSVAVNGGNLSLNAYNMDGLGGLVGHNDYRGFIRTSYASGGITQLNLTISVGGLVGKNQGTVEASYWDATSSGIAVSDGGLALSATEMNQASIFTQAGWDFADVWRLADSFSSPRLRYFNPPPAPVPAESNTGSGQSNSGQSSAGGGFSQQLVTSSIQAIVSSAAAGGSFAGRSLASLNPVSVTSGQRGTGEFGGGLFKISSGGMRYSDSTAADLSSSNDQDN